LHEKDFGKTTIACCSALRPKATHFAVDVRVQFFPFVHVLVDGYQKHVALYGFRHGGNFEVGHMIAVFADAGKTIGVIDVAIAFIVEITGFTIVGNDNAQLYASVHECFANTIFSQHKSKKIIYHSFILCFQYKTVFIFVLKYRKDPLPDTITVTPRHTSTVSSTLSLREATGIQSNATRQPQSFVYLSTDE
jgi:hypothetical protein